MSWGRIEVKVVWRAWGKSGRSLGEKAWREPGREAWGAWKGGLERIGKLARKAWRPGGGLEETSGRPGSGTPGGGLGELERDLFVVFMDFHIFSSIFIDSQLFLLIVIDFH